MSSPNRCDQKCCQFCRWTKFSKSPPQKSLFLPALVFRLSRMERRGADTVPQPDLYSGQAVYYIKKVLGLCKSTCFTFSFPNFPKPWAIIETPIRGEVKKSAKPWTSPQPFSGCFPCFCPSICLTDNAEHFFALCLFDMCNIRWNIPVPAHTFELLSQGKKIFFLEDKFSVLILCPMAQTRRGELSLNILGSFHQS